MRQIQINIGAKNNNVRAQVKPMGPAITSLRRSSLISLSPRRSTLIGTNPNVIIINKLEAVR